jgi:hypothetical protein
MKPYRTSFDTETVRISASGGNVTKTIASNCNAIYFRIEHVDAPGSAAGTGASWDFVFAQLKPRINGIRVFPVIAGEGGFASTIEARNIAAGPDLLRFESPDPYGLITENFKFECEPVVGYAFPIFLSVIRRKISFLDGPTNQLFEKVRIS